MAHYADEDVIPIPRDRLWQFLELHTHDETISRIHPEIVSQRFLSHSGNEYVLERHIDFMRGERRSTWKLTYRPPDSARWEILESDGPMATGSFLINSYAEVSGGTLVRSEGEITIVRAPRLLQKRLVRSAMNRIDDQDREFLATHPF